jgi:hypothetical protein
LGENYENVKKTGQISKNNQKNCKIAFFLKIAEKAKKRHFQVS